jgi:Pyruvate/2-oxoacid:ferredoxin oxidoreductase delta subunit
MPELLSGNSVVDYDRRNGCGDCMPVCPSHAIEMLPVSEAYG